LDSAKVGFGELVAGVSAVLLFIFMFLPWYSTGLISAVGLGTISGSANLSAWDAFSGTDLILLLVVLVTVGLVAADVSGSLPEMPQPPGAFIAGAGALALLLIFFRIVNPPGPSEADLSRELGLFLGFVAAAGIAFGGYTAMNEQAAAQSSRR
jgi:hypothetical protein